MPGWGPMPVLEVSCPCRNHSLGFWGLWAETLGSFPPNPIPRRPLVPPQVQPGSSPTPPAPPLESPELFGAIKVSFCGMSFLFVLLHDASIPRSSACTSPSYTVPTPRAGSHRRLFPAPHTAPRPQSHHPDPRLHPAGSTGGERPHLGVPSAPPPPLQAQQHRGLKCRRAGDRRKAAGC